MSLVGAGSLFHSERQVLRDGARGPESRGFPIGDLLPLGPEQGTWWWSQKRGSGLATWVGQGILLLL